MANIAILGWGSLIWDPRTIQIDGNWRKNGPLFPLEFSRLSESSLTSSRSEDRSPKRLTLTITPGRPVVPTLWTFSRFESLEGAISDLANREGCGNASIGYYDWRSGRMQAQREAELLRDAVEVWRSNCDSGERPIDAVIWTDLGPKFQEASSYDFNLANVLGFFDGLSGVHWERASEYILRAPTQVSTLMRPALETYIHERRLTADFERPLLGPRSGVRRVYLDEIPVVEDWGKEGLTRDAMLPVWANGKPGRVWIQRRHHASTRFELELEVPAFDAQEILTPEGQVRWLFGTKYFEMKGNYILDAAGNSFTFLHR